MRLLSTKILLSLIVLLEALPGVARADGPAPGERNYTGRVTDPVQVCMVKRNVQSHTPYTDVYQDKTYHFCCTACLTKFKADPEQEKWAKDPVNGKAVDKADALIYSYQGRAFFFSSERTLKKFSRKPTKYRETP